MRSAPPRVYSAESVKIHLSRFWKRIGRRLALSAIALLLCFSMSVQQTRADVAFFEWLSDTRVTLSLGYLARAAAWIRVFLADLAMRFPDPPQEQTTPYPAPGAPYPWQSSDPCAPFSTVNLATGNLFTAVPLFELPGAGEGLSFSFYHNTINTYLNEMVTMPANWSHTYSRRLAVR